MLKQAGLTRGPHTLQVAKIHTDLAYRLERTHEGWSVALADRDGNVEITFFEGRDTLRRARTHVNRRKRGEL